jgi:hypothetical protein
VTPIKWERQNPGIAIPWRILQLGNQRPQNHAKTAAKISGKLVTL